MKSLLRAFLFNFLSIYFAAIIVPGFVVKGGFITISIAAIFLTLLNFFVKPVAKLLFFPINLVTLGFFSWVINALILWLLVVFLPQLHATSWTFNGASFNGFSIPKFVFTPVLTIIVVSFTISLFTHILNWVRK